MDFGAVGFDGLVVGSSDISGFSSDPEMKQKWYDSASVSGFLHKQERSGSGGVAEMEDLRVSKLPKTSASSLLRSNSPFFVSDSNQNHHQMLCFSSPKAEPPRLDKTASLSAASANFVRSSAPRNAGGSYGGLNGGSMHGGGFIGVRAPFTPSQWMELEHQALIYKYITANVHVPSNLLIPIRKALESAGIPTFSGGFLRPTAVGWGAFNVGFSNNSDPEPGRCRRTDGKKWRCSRDAVADQKYCERHMNRGRHRSRKPVEGQAGHSHSVAGASNITTAATTTTTITTTSKLISSSPPSMTAVPSNASPNTISCAGTHHFKNLNRGGSHPPPSSATAPQINRMFITNKENGGVGLHDSSSMNMKQFKQLPFAINKQNPFEESPRTEFTSVSSNFLLNPSQKASSLMTYRAFNPSEGLTTSQPAAETQHWPKNQSDSSSVSWSNWNPDLQSDRTQLSISIPMATSDFRSSTSSPVHEKLTLSPLRSSQEFDPIQMGLGVGNNVMDEANNRLANWIPISWESSMGGPLGEVLHSTNNNSGESKNSSILNLMTEGWDISSSPTGVLQKTAFGSFSNSSTGSSPRTDNNNKTHEVGGGGGSQCSDRLGSTFVNSSSSLPSG